MGQPVFIPLTDELLEQHPELIARLVPYHPGLPCYHWLGRRTDGEQSEDAQLETPPAPLRAAG